MMYLVCYITKFKFVIFFHLIISFINDNTVECGAIVLTQETLDTILATKELVFINFYADWCRFSKLMGPMFDSAADIIANEPSYSGLAVMGKVDCTKEHALAMRFNIIKYPTLKIIRNGQLVKREYRGQRTADAFVEFVKKHLEDDIEEIKNIKDLKNMNSQKRNLIGFFDQKEVPEFKIFKKAAVNLKGFCQFHVGFGLLKYNDKTEHAMANSMIHSNNFFQTLIKPIGKHTIEIQSQSLLIFRPDIELTNEGDEIFKGSLLNYNDVNTWMADKCFPLVREVTYENAEELTEEGLPFLILFHKPGDFDTVKRFKDICKTLAHERKYINFITADGERFSHPLGYLSKSQLDLPIIAIDSFRHMHLFNDILDLDVPGKLKQFIKDFHSGKLHRELHNGPDNNEASQLESEKQITTKPPESAFKSLGPSNKRYTLLRDEL